MRHVAGYSMLLALHLGCRGQADAPRPSEEKAPAVAPAAEPPAADAEVAAPSDSAEPQAATEPEPPKGGLAAAVEAIHRPDVRQVQERLAKVLPTTRLASGPPKTAIAWAPPSCPLRYGFQADLTMAVTDLPTDIDPSLAEQGIRVAGDFTMRAEGARAVIRNGPLEVSQVMQGIKNPGGKEEPGALAEIRLERSGRQWKEVDGPTALWSAYGSFPGLVEFWPALPADTAPGHRQAWALTVHDQGNGAKVESERGSLKVPEGFAFPPPTPHTFDAQVEVQGWLDVNGEPAVVLVSQWTHDDQSELGGPESKADPGVPKPPAVDVDLAIEARSRYVVLASGRLLWADVHRTTDVEMSMGPGKSMKQRHDLRANARLVEACDGPVIVESPPAPSPEEAALEAFALLRNAAHEGNADTMVRHLAPALVGRHGKEPLTRLLHEHVERLGILSLGTPEMAMDVRREGALVRMRMTGNARRADGTTMTVHTVAWAHMVGDKAFIETIGTDTTERDEGWSVLEISMGTMVSGDVK